MVNVGEITYGQNITPIKIIRKLQVVDTLIPPELPRFNQNFHFNNKYVRKYVVYNSKQPMIKYTNHSDLIIIFNGFLQYKP